MLSEQRLKEAVAEVRGLATKIVREKKKELVEKLVLEGVDILSWCLSFGHSDESFAVDNVLISASCVFLLLKQSWEWIKFKGRRREYGIRRLDKDRGVCYKFVIHWSMK